MFTYRVDLEYQGTRYSGWQVQANARTVAGELLRALREAGAPRVVELGGAGRTDAGVHALRQTAHLRLGGSIDPPHLAAAVNERLPADIHVLSVLPAGRDFHARHDAVVRSYLYQLSRRRTGMAKKYVWWVKRALRLESIQEAAAELVGRHDFRLLCEAPARQPSTLVVVEEVTVSEEGDLVLFRLVASHFLWKMVRRTIGALVRVGTGELSLEAWRRLVDPGRDRPDGASGVVAWTAPPSGLFLERVVYPGEEPLAPLAAATPVKSGRGDARPLLGGAPRDERPAGGRAGARRPRRRRGPRAA